MFKSGNTSSTQSGSTFSSHSYVSLTKVYSMVTATTTPTIPLGAKDHPRLQDIQDLETKSSRIDLTAMMKVTDVDVDALPGYWLGPTNYHIENPRLNLRF